MAGSLLTPEQRAGFRARVEPLARVFGRVGLTPNALTVIGLLIACVAAAIAGARWWTVAGLLVVFGGAFDMFDGALARATGKASIFGAFLDSTLDRAGEAVIYVGIVYGLAVIQDTTGAVLAAAAMAAAFMVSYARAKAESLGFTGGSGMANVGARAPGGSHRDPHVGPLDHRHLGGPAAARPQPGADRAPGRHHHRHSGSSWSATNPSRSIHKGDSLVMAKNDSGSQNGNGRHPRRKDGKIRVAIVGVGNCASSLVQGRYYYEDATDDDFVPGLMHVNLGGYHVRDIEFVAAFDIDKNKVGKDLSEAIYAKPNNTYVFQQVPHTRREGRARHDPRRPGQVPVADHREGARPHGRRRRHPQGAQGRRVVSYLPVGSEEATKWYVEQALKAGVGFINAIPVFIGREPYWQRRFAEEGLPIIGDDIKSQVGATITHRVLTRLFMDRGVRLDRTYQLNFGGNTDFLNMLERERLESKKISKTNAVTSMLDYELDPDDIHVGPSDHVPWLHDRKWCYIRMEGTTFGDVPLNAELKLEVWDSPNSAGVITDAIRCLKLGLDRGLKGTLVAPSSYFMKSPPIQIHDDIAFNRVEAFIRGEDNETLVGTEAHAPRRRANSRNPAAAPRSSSRRVPHPSRRQPATGTRRHARPRLPRRVSPRLLPGFMTDETRAPDSGVRYSPHRRIEIGRPAPARPSHARAWRRPRLPCRRDRHRPHQPARQRAGRTPAVRRAATTAGRRSGASSRPTPRTCSARRVDDPPCAVSRGSIYASYAEFALELMRLPSRPVDEPLTLVQGAPDHGIDSFIALWKEHAGSRQGPHHRVRATSAASRSSPRPARSGASRPTASPTTPRTRSCSHGSRKCARAAACRSSRGATCARSSARCGKPAVLGLVVDWGYRPEDVPVPLFGEWTTLPAGPATLAAKTGASIVPVVNRRRPTARTSARTSIRSRSPTARRREIRRATQPIADALEEMVRVQPEQWFTFKPMWPTQRRGSGRARAARSRNGCRVNDRGGTRDGGGHAGNADEQPLRLVDRVMLALLLGGVRLLQALPESFVLRTAALIGRVCYSAMPARRRLVRANLRRVCVELASRGTGPERARTAATNDRALDALVRSAFGHWVRTYVESAIAPALIAAADFSIASSWPTPTSPSEPSTRLRAVEARCSSASTSAPSSWLRLRRPQGKP